MADRVGGIGEDASQAASVCGLIARENPSSDSSIAVILQETLNGLYHAGQYLTDTGTENKADNSRVFAGLMRKTEVLRELCG